jgi:cytochrome c oxidase assembly protein subunit 11
MKDIDKSPDSRSETDPEISGDKTGAAPTSSDVLPYADGTHVQADHTKLLKIMGAVLLGSFAFGWASIPLYRMVCAKLDPGGSSALNGSVSTYENVDVDKSRTVHVRFSAIVNGRLPWEFSATELSVDVHPGEKRLTKFQAKNLSPTQTIIGKAVYDIVPAEAAPYFKKIECFCFKEQTLKPKESVDMPLYFWFEPDLPDHIKEVTLAYTFFNAGVVEKPTKTASADKL